MEFQRLSMEAESRYEEIHQGIREMIHEQPDTSCEGDETHKHHGSADEEEEFIDGADPHSLLSDDHPGDIGHAGRHTPPDSQDEGGEAEEEEEEEEAEDDENDPEYVDEGGNRHSLKDTAGPKSSGGGGNGSRFRWGNKGIDDGRRHNGRPPKLSPKQLKQIETTLEESQGTLSSTELLRILKFDVSARTIRRAKRAIMEKRCQARRNSVIMAARSLAAAAAAVGGQNYGVNPTTGQPVMNARLLKSHRRREDASGVAVQ